MKVKICGITDLQTALFAIESGADAIGFVFAESKRRISPERAKKIISCLPDSIMKVGVFVNETKDKIEQIADYAGLTAIQLHGDETPEFSRQFSLPVIKAIRVGSSKDLDKISSYSCQYILLDSPKGKYYGGNGIAFDWTVAANKASSNKNIILAGGLDEGNVAEAIATVRPYMVDVSSGVETDGKKDLDKIRKFIRKAKEGEKQ